MHLLNLIQSRCGAFQVNLARASTLYLFVLIATGPSVLLHGQIVSWGNTSGIPAPLFHEGHNWLGGLPPGANSTAKFDLGGSYQVWWNSFSASSIPVVRALGINQGSVVFHNQDALDRHQLTISGTGGGGAFNDLSISGANTELMIQGLNLRSLGGAQVINGASLSVDGSHPSGSAFHVIGVNGFQVEGTLDIGNGAVVESTAGYVGMAAGSTGSARISGIDSRWINSGDLYIGRDGNASMIVGNGGLVQNAEGFIGLNEDSTGLVTVAGPTATWENTGRLLVGFSGTGSLVIENGGRVINTSSVVGMISRDLNNMVRVNGAGSEWNNSGRLEIGRSGSGRLIVENGGVITCGSSDVSSHGGVTSLVTVQDPGSKWTSAGDLYIGQFGDAELTIANGGFVRGHRVAIGVQNFMTGEAVIRGSGSRLESVMELTVGEYGFGSMLIESGGAIHSLQGRIGTSSTFARGDVIVRGIGSRWDNTIEMFVGSDGDAKLLIESGGIVTNSAGYIQGNGLMRTAQVTVNGAGSQWINSTTLYVGRVNNGSLTIENGGFVSNADAFIGVYEHSNGEVVVRGRTSSWMNSGNLYVGVNDLGMIDSAIVNLVDEGLLTGRSVVKIGASGTVNLNGGTLNAKTLDVTEGVFNMLGGTLHAETVIGDLHNIGAVIAPGESPGITTIYGSLVQESDATIQIELGGLDPGTFDQLVIHDDLELGDSTLSVLLWNGFQLGPDMQFLIVDVDGNLSGRFFGLDDGDIVGSFPGVNLHITYGDGQGGNGVMLFTAVPEPSTATYILASVALGLIVVRRSRQGGSSSARSM